MMEITGVIERTTFQNEENGFTVARLARTDEKTGSELVTVVGYLSGVHSGETIRLYGDWTMHPSYGQQFTVDHFETMPPVTPEGMEKYLGSGLIKGIGPVTAEKIVRTFGVLALKIIEENPERLQEVEGIGPNKAEKIIKALEETKDMRRVMLFLRGAGITPALSNKIFRNFGNKSIEILKANPYILAEKVNGIGFKTADRIAGLLGRKDLFAPERIRAGILYLLRKNTEEGHVYADFAEFVDKTQDELMVKNNQIQVEIEKLTLDRQVFLEDNRLYLAPLYHSERGVVAKLMALYQYFQEQTDIFGSVNATIDIRDIAGGRADLPTQENRRSVSDTNHAADGQGWSSLSPEQQQAVEMAQREGILVITGGPGTGKTTIVRNLLDLYRERGWRVLLAAPTGRAAKRLSETTGLTAKTIHRLLEFGFTGTEAGYNRDEKKPLEAEVVIVDEVSMVDLLLFYHLLKAIPLGTRLVLVGDEDQLPSVGPGTVLRDILSSGVIPQVKLRTIFRQARESQIVTNAHLIKEGIMPKVKETKDFFFIPADEPEKVVDEVIRLVTLRLPRYLKCDPSEEIQVLSPMRRTITGVDNFNQILQKVLNPESSGKPELQYGGKVFRQGDKVMQIRNNYQKMVFNGDVGRITKVDPEEQQVEVGFSDLEENRVLYEPDELDELVLSYAVTVHKSQGSEYPVVILPITTQHFVMLQRNLFYTAITRARKMVVLVGTKKAIAIAVKNDRIDQRNSRLAELITEYARERAEEETGCFKRK